MKKSDYKSFDDLPLMLSVAEMAEVLGIGLSKAYTLARRKDFPSIKIGSRMIVPRDRLMQWLDQQADKKSEMF